MDGCWKISIPFSSLTGQYRWLETIRDGRNRWRWAAILLLFHSAWMQRRASCDIRSRLWNLLLQLTILVERKANTQQLQPAAAKREHDAAGKARRSEGVVNWFIIINLSSRSGRRSIYSICYYMPDV